MPQKKNTTPTTKRRRAKFVYKDGKLRGIYDDAIGRKMVEAFHGRLTLKKVSHVTPVPNPKAIEFQIDLSPVNGPIIRGFPSYKDAVDAEVRWLEENHITLSCPKKSH